MGITHYELLRVHKGATIEEIERAYRVASKAFHPDAGGPAANSALFREATNARDTLIDPFRRRLYDEGLARDPGPVSQASTNDGHASNRPPTGDGGTGGSTTKTTPTAPKQRTRRSFSLLAAAGVTYVVSRWVIQFGYQVHVSFIASCGHQLMASSGILVFTFFGVPKERVERILSRAKNLLSRFLALHRAKSGTRQTSPGSKR